MGYFLLIIYCFVPNFRHTLANNGNSLMIPGIGCGLSKEIRTISQLPPGEVHFDDLGCARVTPQIYQMYQDQAKQWVSTSDWSQCSISCGTGGFKTRNRECKTANQLLDPSECPGGNVIVTMQCNNFDCPINGGWSNYTSFGSCDVTCGNGTQTRSRTCTNPSPFAGGVNCVGSATDTQICATGSICPVNGSWSFYTSFGSCSVTCGNGTQTRSRTCTSPPPSGGGVNCSGSDSDTQNCYTGMCPVNGSWSSYTAIGSCSVTCGNGTQTISRTCTNPPPSGGGVNCIGNTTDTQSCATGNVCPVTCGTDITSFNGTVTSQNYPSNYAANTDCSSLVTVPSGYRIAITFSSNFKLESTYDYLYLYDGNSSTANEMGTALTGTTPPSTTWITSGNQLIITMTSDYSNQYQGFSLNFIASLLATTYPATTTVTCGTDFTRYNGIVTSQNYPSNYAANTDCTSLVKVPSGYRIAITFSSNFKLESNYDYLYLYDGNSTSANEMGTPLTGTTPPSGPWVTSGNQLFIMMTSDLSNQYQGFSLNFTATLLASNYPVTVMCGSSISNATTGYVLSPNYPNDYDNNDDCYTLVTVPSGNTIQMSFTAFQTESGFDYLYLYDGSSTSATKLATLSGDSLPSSYSTTGNVLYVKFTSDSSDTESGFKMLFTAQ